VPIRSKKKGKTRSYDGIAASPGIAIGPAYIYDNVHVWIEERDIPSDGIESEKVRFSDAVDVVINDLTSLRAKLADKIGDDNARIFDTHIMLLKDPAVIQETTRLIEQGKCAEFAFFRTTRMLVKAYKKLDDEYMRERIVDFTDILRRVTGKLLGNDPLTLNNLTDPVIVIAPVLTPSDTAHMHATSIKAFVTDTGGSTSHASILARALTIPAVLSVKTASSEINHGDMVIVDGTDGTVIVNPDADTVALYRKKIEQDKKARHTLSENRDLPAITRDGIQVELHANIEFPDEVKSVLENGAEGIGLYRSEFHLLADDSEPDEEDLFRNYHEVAERLAPRRVIIRTFDLGGDKVSHLIPSTPEDNPFLGWRAIRVSLVLKDMFKTHLRAILRASRLRNVSVMFPMISSADEIDEALAILDEVKVELAAEGQDFDPAMKVGIMIELPAAVMIAGRLAEKVDFFSIGTNDLIQYSVAVDRANDRIAYLFQPLHPGILKLMKITIDAAHAANIPVAVCGEMGADPESALLLMGLGIDELSMVPSFIPSIKSVIRSMSMERAREIALLAVDCASASEVKKLVQDELARL
jgi:phosphoenolpyruvate-protein phosphotransferase (PTS system enzyme I)